MRRPSDLKQTVADKLREAFKSQFDLHFNVFPGDFRTADGYWRRADVYRWQIYGELFLPEGVRRVEVSSWASLSMCRVGVLWITRAKWANDYEADPVKNKLERERLIEKHRNDV